MSRRCAHGTILLAMFVPTMILSWLNLDIATASRYAISYAALHALLAAAGFFAIGDIVARTSRRAATVIGATLTLCMAAIMAVWSFEAVALQRSQSSPVAAAFAWIRANVPADTTVYVEASLAPHARLLLPAHRRVLFDEPDEVAAVANRGWIVQAVRRPGRVFTWPRDNSLWKILRSRNFEVTIAETSMHPKFGSGWYDEESDGASFWRWMAGDAKVLLPPVMPQARLDLRFVAPIEDLPHPPTVTVELNGGVIDSFVVTTKDVTRSWKVESRSEGLNELTIRTSGTVVPAAMGRSPDRRELGLMFHSLVWGPWR